MLKKLIILVIIFMNIANAGIPIRDVIPGYIVHNKQVLYSERATAIDASTVKIFDLYYAKDKNGLYYQGNKVDISPKGFISLDNGCARAQENIYFAGKIIHDADPQTFRQLGRSYSADKVYVYCLNEIFADGDPDTFILLDNGYAKDKNNAYYRRQIIAEADSATFELLNAAYSKDKNAVYHFGHVLDGADAATFRVLNNFYALDRNSVYYHGQIIKGADTETGDKHTPGGYAKDSRRVYRMGEAIEGDPKTFIPPPVLLQRLDL